MTCGLSSRLGVAHLQRASMLVTFLVTPMHTPMVVAQEPDRQVMFAETIWSEVDKGLFAVPVNSVEADLQSLQLKRVVALASSIANLEKQEKPPVTHAPGGSSRGSVAPSRPYLESSLAFEIEEWWWINATDPPNTSHRPIGVVAASIQASAQRLGIRLSPDPTLVARTLGSVNEIEASKIADGWRSQASAAGGGAPSRAFSIGSTSGDLMTQIRTVTTGFASAPSYGETADLILQHVSLLKRLLTLPVTPGAQLRALQVDLDAMESKFRVSPKGIADFRTLQTGFEAWFKRLQSYFMTPK
jgi:hypothetical protein